MSKTRFVLIEGGLKGATLGLVTSTVYSVLVLLLAGKQYDGSSFLTDPFMWELAFNLGILPAGLLGLFSGLFFAVLLFFYQPKSCTGKIAVSLILPLLMAIPILVILGSPHMPFEMRASLTFLGEEIIFSVLSLGFLIRLVVINPAKDANQQQSRLIGIGVYMVFWVLIIVNSWMVWNVRLFLLAALFPNGFYLPPFLHFLVM